MKKISINMEIDSYTEKAVKRYCRENSMSVEKFIEEAVFEKLEAEELQKGPFLSEETDDSSGDDLTGNTLFDSDGDSYKKKH